MVAVVGFDLPELLVMSLFSVIALFVAIGGIILWIWALVDCLTNESSQGNDKLVWALLIFLLHWLGALLYLFVRRPKRIKELGR